MQPQHTKVNFRHEQQSFFRYSKGLAHNCDSPVFSFYVVNTVRRLFSFFIVFGIGRGFGRIGCFVSRRFQCFINCRFQRLGSFSLRF